MAEDMRVLDEMLADGGLKVGSEEVEAYKYNYRYNYKYNYSTGITTTITTTCITKSITTGIKLLAIQYKYNYRWPVSIGIRVNKDVIIFLPRNCRQWTSAINLYRGAFTAASRAFWADPGAEWYLT